MERPCNLFILLIAAAPAAACLLVYPKQGTRSFAIM